MVTVVMRCDTTVASGSTPGVGVGDRKLSPVNGGLAGRLQADAHAVEVRHAHDVAELEDGRAHHWHVDCDDVSSFAADCDRSRGLVDGLHRSSKRDLVADHRGLLRARNGG